MDINEVMMKVLEKLDVIDNRLGNLEQGQANLEQGQAKLEQGQAKLEQGQAKLEQWQARADITLGRLDLGQAAIESRLSEHTRILSALQEASRIQRAQLDNIAIDVAHIKGDAIRTQKDVNLLKRSSNVMESITAKNWSEILELKNLKEN